VSVFFSVSFHSLQMIQVNSKSRQQMTFKFANVFLLDTEKLALSVYPLHSKISLFNSILNKIKIH
jgi:hypothetical protein